MVLKKISKQRRADWKKLHSLPNFTFIYLCFQ